MASVIFLVLEMEPMRSRTSLMPAAITCRREAAAAGVVSRGGVGRGAAVRGRGRRCCPAANVRRGAAPLGRIPSNKRGAPIGGRRGARWGRRPAQGRLARRLLGPSHLQLAAAGGGILLPGLEAGDVALEGAGERCHGGLSARLCDLPATCRTLMMTAEAWGGAGRWFPPR